jgi:hypothetical protein
MSFGAIVRELSGASVAHGIREVHWNYLSQQLAELTVGEWLAGERTILSFDNEVCDVAVGEADCVGPILRHRREKSIYSGHCSYDD